ncbi:MAG TPA: DUF4159 domain-containing protein [Tepidisphaeraceae bacterium]|jgi:hypothetical protein|nr:DUF4159 domain-containing protein [Tepidisphaeraceae bacterium]
MRRFFIGIIIAAGLTQVGYAQSAPATMPTPTPAMIDRSAPLSKQVDQAIDKGVAFLLSQQHEDGSWAGVELNDQQDVGRTALVGLALLSCGESHQSPQLAKAIQYLKKVRIGGAYATYTYALRAAFYAQLPESVRKKELPADLQWLQSAMIKQGSVSGMYTYSRTGDQNAQRGFRPWGGDYSNSQYGVLGVWYSSMAGLEISNNYWRLVENAWQKGQANDGGWGYFFGSQNSYSSMTAAGAATLYITNDYLHSQQEMDLRHVNSNPSLERAIKWLGNNFSIDYNNGKDQPPQAAQGNDLLNNIFGGGRAPVRIIGTWIHYMLFGYERVGEASGLTRFGTHKWFDECADFLIQTQNPDGSWTSDPDEYVGSAYCLLFLSRGRSPVAVQKLQFNGRWDNRSRDAAAITRWLTKETERHTNWQIVPVEASDAELRQAPILYVASDRPLVLREAEKQRLKTYIDQGGILLAVNEGTTKEFADSIVKLAHDIYPAYEFGDLPTDHPIYGENFPVKGLPTNPRALSNGVRELMILLPTGDMSWKFQQGAATISPTSSPAFGFVGNLYLYMNDKSNPRFKGDDTWIEADPRVQDQKEIQVARLKINANWNPEPLGWARLANMLHNNDQIKLTVLEVDPEINSLPNSISLIHLTATNSFDLSQIQQNILKQYLDGGGVLFFDAAGGSTAAQLSFETLLIKMYPLEKLKTLPIDHPIYTGLGTGGSRIEQATYRHYAMDRLAKTTLPRLRVLEVNGKVVAIDSSEDLSAGLVGYNIDGVVGYSPASSEAIVRNILLWAGAGRQ